MLNIVDEHLEFIEDEIGCNIGDIIFRNNRYFMLCQHWKTYEKRWISLPDKHLKLNATSIFR